MSGYLLWGAQIASTPHGDVICTPMEIISVTRGDDFRRLWGLSGRPVETISVSPP
ncbi:hypothetical protein [Xylanibacter ruminicola]|uniref:hypothetical protein n=1 Tax=Xylanibacter ruminicola TaxID=839 RepID=UPI0015E1DC5A|nr:hypothetical protein [Xylanibacter ruminicola]